jgi:hypothetical protein
MGLGELDMASASFWRVALYLASGSWAAAAVERVCSPVEACRESAEMVLLIVSTAVASRMSVGEMVRPLLMVPSLLSCEAACTGPNALLGEEPLAGMEAQRRGKRELASHDASNNGS